MIALKPVNGENFMYSHLIATGGIGSGIFFKLVDNHTIGRNESRKGRLVPLKDYCKMHIIMHYVAVLLGANPSGCFRAFAIGKVGNDEIGEKMLREIESVGIDSKNIVVQPDSSTLFSVCFEYPDNTGGNITTEDSASSMVTSGDISLFFDNFEKIEGGELLLAAPEVPLDARIKLLEYGRRRGSFNIASILSSEVEEFKHSGGFEKVDLLSINIDEARAIAGLEDETLEAKLVVEACVNIISLISPSIILVITDGPNGSYGCKDKYIEFTPILDVVVAGTAGAGDTFLSGIITGLCCGLPLFKGKRDTYFSETPLCSALEFGNMLAALSVTSRDAIHQYADAEKLLIFAEKNNLSFGKDFKKVFSF